MVNEKIIPKSRYVGYAIAGAEILFAVCYFGWRLADWLSPLVSAWATSARNAAIAAAQATPMPTATPIPVPDVATSLVVMAIQSAEPVFGLIMAVAMVSVVVSFMAKVIRAIE